MPKSLILAAVFAVMAVAVAPAGTAVAQGQRFPDVPADHWAFEAVEWAASAGVTLGYGDGTFRPSVALGRWHALTFMERYYDEILQASESPDFTRADMMVLLKAINDGTLRNPDASDDSTAGAPGSGEGQRFPDVPADHWAFEAVEWAAEAGVTLGYGDGTFRPSVALGRWHALVFMERYYDEILGADESPDFTRADMMVLLKAINDGTFRSTDPPGDPDDWVLEIPPNPVWLEEYRAVLAFFEQCCETSEDEETMRRMWNELIGDDCDAGVHGVCRGLSGGQMLAMRSRRACPRGWSLALGSSHDPQHDYFMCFHPDNEGDHTGGYIPSDAYYPPEEADPRGVRRNHWERNAG